MPIVLLLLACDGANTDSPTDSPQDSAQELPAAVVDVLVIGGGPAGLSAALEAQALGAEVLVLEMGERAGGSGWYAENFFAAGSDLQAERGVEDSPELALSQWADFTGGDPEDPWVQAFVRDSADNLRWMEAQGAEVFDLGVDVAMGPLPRSHRLRAGDEGAVAPLVAALSAQTWLETRADSLVREGEQVVGARYTALATGETGWVQAGAVVVATGGFARDSERMLADRPELSAFTLRFEAAPHSLGLGLDLLEPLGAALSAPGRSGVYVHSVADYREGYAGEVLWLPGLFSGLIFDRSGARITNEQKLQTFGLFQQLLDAPDQRLFALVPAPILEELGPLVPPYNNLDGAQALTLDELVDGGVLGRFDTIGEAAAWAGADAEALAATLARYELQVAQQRDDDFGKEARFLIPFGGGPLYVMELVPGSAKSFVGVSLDLEARVLDAEGAPIPGLYAAGEVAGFLGSDAIGEGLSGAVNAAYYTGRVAGRNAAP